MPKVALPSEDHPANFVMTMLVGMSDPGMIVLANAPIACAARRRFPPTRLWRSWRPQFECEKLPSGIEQANEAWAKMEAADEQGLMAFFGSKTRRGCSQSVRLSGAGDRLKANSRAIKATIGERLASACFTVW